jgi:tetratricopeptide (TPR) repeat protein
MDVRLIKKKFDQLDTSIIQQPAKASNYADRALIFTALQTYDHALSDFDKAIDLDPFNALSYFSRANTRLKLLSLLHSDNPAVTAKLHSLSPAMVSGTSYQSAIADYTSALALDSTFSYAWYNRASAKMFINDYDGAVNDLTMAIYYDPNLADAYYNKGLLLILIHQNETACISLSKAGELGILEAYPVIKKYCDK